MLWLAAEKVREKKTYYSFKLQPISRCPSSYMKLGDDADVRMKKLGQRGICIVKCKALTKK
jgi:hypothetical protein